MTDGPDAFLLQGLRHYPDAFAVVEQFKKQLREHIQARVRAHAWRAWKPDLSGLSLTRSEADGLWLGVGCPGRVAPFPDVVNVDVGILWGRAGVEGNCEVGVSAWNIPDWLRRVWRVSRDFEAVGGRVEKKYLYVPIDVDAVDLDRALDSVLLAFDGCAEDAARAAT